MQLFLASIDLDQFILEDAEALHCARVLRKTTGDDIDFITGDGHLYTGRIAEITKKRVTGTYTLQREHFGEVPYSLTMAVAPTKNIDRFEWFIEKAIEMGVKRIVPILCERSERKVVKQERLEKIALSATKQSLKGTLTKIEPLTPWKEFLLSADNQCFIAHCEPTERVYFQHLDLDENTPIHILIGPEGDFSPEEINWAVDHGAIPIDLGKSRLRTETAALFAVASVYARLG